MSLSIASSYRAVTPRAIAVVFLLAGARAQAQQPLETETARLPLHRELLIDAAYEFQTSSQGTEHALPIAVEYGVTDRLNLLVEPVFFTGIFPRLGTRATGIGDIEVTTQYLLVHEGAALPAIALAAEEKFPTARNQAIGTGRADFTPYVIASKRFGAFDAHVNIGYSFMGKPSGLAVQNTLNLAAAVERHLSGHVDVMAEVLSTSASLSGGEGAIDPNAPELAGAEQVVMVGIRKLSGARTWWSFGVTYDNTNAVLLRPGVSIAVR